MKHDCYATTSAAQCADETLTLQRLAQVMKELEALMPPRDSTPQICGVPVFVAPEYPKVKLNYKCRTKYGDEFEFLTPQQKAETNAWLLARFDTTSSIPPGTAYMLGGMFGPSLHLNHRDAMKLSVMT